MSILSDGTYKRVALFDGRWLLRKKRGKSRNHSHLPQWLTSMRLSVPVPDIFTTMDTKVQCADPEGSHVPMEVQVEQNK